MAVQYLYLYVSAAHHLEIDGEQYVSILTGTEAVTCLVASLCRQWLSTLR